MTTTTNASKKTGRTPAPPAVAPAPVAAAIAAPAVHARPKPEVKIDELSDDDLKGMLSLLREEAKRRDEARLSTLPKKDAQYRVVAGSKRLVGKVGKVISSGRTRAFLDIELSPGKSMPFYLRIVDIAPVG